MNATRFAKLAGYIVSCMILFQAPTIYIKRDQHTPSSYTSPLEIIVVYNAGTSKVPAGVLKGALVPGAVVRDGLRWLECKTGLVEASCNHAPTFDLPRMFTADVQQYDPAYLMRAMLNTYGQQMGFVSLGSVVLCMGGLLTFLLPTKLTLMGVGALMWGVIQSRAEIAPLLWLLCVLAVVATLMGETQPGQYFAKKLVEQTHPQKHWDPQAAPKQTASKGPKTSGKKGKKKTK